MIALSEIAAKCEGVKWKGDGAFLAKCPAHDDGHASLSGKKSDAGKVLVKCHAGCDFADIIGALGINAQDLFPDDTRKNNKRPTLGDFAAAKKLPTTYLRERGLFDLADGGIGITYRDVNGNPIATKKRLHTEAKEGSRWPKGLKLAAYGLERLSRARELGVLHLVEGESDQLTLDHAGFAALGVPGADTAKKVLARAHLDGVKTIFYVREPDTGGDTFAERIPDHLRTLGWQGELREVKLPTKDPSDLWVRDPQVFPAQYQAALDASTAIDFQASPAAPPPSTSSRPRIKMRPQVHEVVPETINALKTAPIFQRGGFLVHIIHEQDESSAIDRPPNAPRIALLPQPRLRELMSECADWYRVKDGEETIIPPPGDVAQMVAARGDWPGISRLEGLSEVPILRRDGTIHGTAGYDPESRVVYMPPSGEEIAPIVDRPDLAEAKRARDLLLDVLIDFPFASDAHRAAAIAMMLTPFARPAFQGPSPLGLIDANIRAAGKGLLADVIAMVYSSRPIARTALPMTDDEMRKRITSVALAGDLIVLIDNIGSCLAFPSFDSALTATVWSDRILGVSQTTPAIPMRMMWLGTGNNISLGADTTRRVLHIRLESREEKPEERDDFTHPDILGYVRARRPLLVSAALTIIRAYFVAGRPPQDFKKWGSFEGWSDLVRSAVVWCGLEDPGSTREQFAADADVEANALRTIIEQMELLTGAGHTSSELLQCCAKGSEFAGLREAIDELCPTANGKPPTPKSLGRRLEHLRGRVVGGKYIDKMSKTQSPIRWVVKHAIKGE